MAVYFFLSLLSDRLNNIKADQFRQDRLLQATWSAFLGYIIALRTERFRREHRQTAVAIAHHRCVLRLCAQWI